METTAALGGAIMQIEAFRNVPIGPSFGRMLIHDRLVSDFSADSRHFVPIGGQRMAATRLQV